MMASVLIGMSAVGMSLLAVAVVIVTAVITLSREVKMHGGQTQVLVGGKTLWVNLSVDAVEAVLREHEAKRPEAPSPRLSETTA